MSLFDTLLGNTSNANTNTAANQTTTQGEQKNTTSNTNQNVATNQQQTSNQSSQTASGTKQANTSQATGQNVTQQLGQSSIDATTALLTSLITKASGGNADADAVRTLAQNLQAKSAQPAVSDADIAGKQSAAVTSFNQNEAVDVSKVQNTIGHGAGSNTYSDLVEKKGQQDLSSTLAGIVADAHLNNAKISDEQLQSAVQALTSAAGIGGADISNIAGILSVLKGAQTTENTSQGISGATTQDTQSSTIQQLLDFLQSNSATQQSTNESQDTSAVGTVASNTNTAGKEGSGLLGWIF